MISLLQLLTEHAPTEAVKGAEILASYICSNVEVEEMRANRGKDFTSTNMYQIRVKPIDKDIELETLLTRIHKALKTSEAKKLGVSNVNINQTSVNSSKFSSVSFTYQCC